MRRSELKQRAMIRQAEIAIEKDEAQEIANKIIDEEVYKWHDECHLSMEAASERGEFHCNVRVANMMAGAKDRLFALMSEFSPAWVCDDRGMTIFLSLRWD